jgi:GNAT superfamily N-acetyltransferase
LTRGLELALELDRRVTIRGGLEVTEIPEGVVVRHRELANVHSLNAVILDAPLPARIDASALTALTDHWLAGLDHRFVRLDDSEAGERLAPELVSAGWERERTVFMVFRGDPGQATRDPRAREISDAEMRELMLANFKQYDYGQDTSPGLPQRLVEAHFEVRRGTPALGFGAGEDGGLQSMCTLFLDPDVDGTRVAMVEQVGTFPSYRGRGLAKAVVSAAVRAGGEWGAELITVPADADDWPQLIYANLGFEPVGVQVQFKRRLKTAPGVTCETPG